MKEFCEDVLLITAYYISCCTFFYAVEDWTFTDAVYFLTTTVTTVGYGDIAPATKLGKVATCPMIVVGIISIFSKLSKYATYMQQWINEHHVNLFARVGIKLVNVEALPIETYSPEQVNAMINYPRRYLLKLAPTLLLIGLMFAYGSIDMGYTVVESIYFTVVTVTTVGYGDLHPTSNRQKLFFCTASLVLVVVVANTISEILVVRTRRKVREGRFALPDLEELMLQKVYSAPEISAPELTESDYIVDALLKGKLVDSEVLLAIRRIFHWTAKGGDDDHSDISTEDLFHFLQHRHFDSQERPEGTKTTAVAPAVIDAPLEGISYEEWFASIWEPKARRARIDGAKAKLMHRDITSKSAAVLAAIVNTRAAAAPDGAFSQHEISEARTVDSTTPTR
ncbi:hypothetical protein CTAYLR_009106 [Chrysophaeum taylorii]|uniref:Potassium channel domain-containing protein n=1 Tax=Chrysophaeum taylorii TaxID=2483200 RepID=A0AAD7UIA6_9STRA|nr:hypothetical protein CTAYLR_009106 [Chrysophaeum taylorii]